MKRIVLAAAIATITAPLAVAGPIDNACNRAERSASPGLCGCIQQAADMTLSRADQRRAAAFFKNAQKAQEARASKRASDSAFWGRYKNFTATAEVYCR